jgi:hypothetical protein
MIRGRYAPSKVFFLLGSFTASYAASRIQQSVLLYSGVASGKLHRKVLFLLGAFTASYAASGIQQSVLLYSGVASGKLYLP